MAGNTLRGGFRGTSQRHRQGVREEHESFASVASGSQTISHREAESDPVLAKLMTPSAVECAVATLKKRKGIGP